MRKYKNTKIQTCKNTNLTVSSMKQTNKLTIQKTTKNYYRNACDSNLNYCISHLEKEKTRILDEGFFRELYQTVDFFVVLFSLLFLASN